MMGHPVIQAELCINPLGISPLARRAMRAALAHGHLYPVQDDLVGKLASHLAIPRDTIVLGAGATELLRAIPGAFAADGNVVQAREAYRSVAKACELRGVASKMVPLDGALRHDLTAMAAAIDDRTRVVVVCNPNNPTGTWLTAAEIIAFARNIPGHVVCVVDEAYADFLPSVSAATAATTMTNVLVLRTFSKVYGLAGARIGYAIGHADLVRRLAANCLPYGVSTVSIAGAMAALDDEDHVQASRSFAAQCRSYFEREFAARGIPCVLGPAMTALIGTGNNARTVVTRLRNRGIYLKAADVWDLPDFVRATYCLPQENEQLVDALQEALQVA